MKMSNILGRLATSITFSLLIVSSQKETRIAVAQAYSPTITAG
jgi:hypothetical protein